MFTLRRTRSALFVFRHYFKENRGQQKQKVTGMSSEHIFNDNFVYISFPHAPIYLREDKLRDKTETESRISGGLDKYCHGRRSIYLAFPKGDAPVDNYIWSSIQSQKLFRQSSVLKDIGVAHCLSFSKNGLISSQQNESKNSFCRGVCIYQENEGEVVDNDDIDAVLQEAEEQDFDIFCVSLSATDHKQLIWKDITGRQEGSEECMVTCVDSSDVASELKQSCVSPVFTLSNISPVHHSFEEARNVLEKVYILRQLIPSLIFTLIFTFFSKLNNNAKACMIFLPLSQGKAETKCICQRRVRHP